MKTGMRYGLELAIAEYSVLSRPKSIFRSMRESKLSTHNILQCLAEEFNPFELLLVL